MLKADCIHRLNIVKVISSRNWGADQTILTMTYKAIIRSKLDYAITIYSSASKNQLNKLEVMNNSGARISTGAFKSSPTFSILAEANHPTLEYRRKTLNFSYATSAIATPRNKLYRFNFTHEGVSHLRFTSLTTRLSIDLRKINFEFPKLFPKRDFSASVTVQITRPGDQYASSPTQARRRRRRARVNVGGAT